MREPGRGDLAWRGEYAPEAQMTHHAGCFHFIGLVVLIAGCQGLPSDARLAAPSPEVSTAPSGASVAPAPTARPWLQPASSPSPTPASAILPGAVDRSSLDLTATYDVHLDVAVDSGVVTVETEIHVRNDSGGPIDRLELNTVATRLGDLAITAAAVDDRPVSVVIDDQTLLVPLGGVLAEKSAATVRLGYKATLRHDLAGSDWLFSRAGGTLALYRWIPWVSRAIPFDRPNHGDPFVTPTSPRVQIEVGTDRPMVLASPDNAPVEAGRTWRLDLRDVRDVAIVLAPDFTVTTGESDGIAIRAYTRPGGLDGDRLVSQAAHALASMADRLGIAYPWPALTVVETEGGYGMESPGLIWVPSGTAPGNLSYLVHHETAHQWFYGLVGSDQQAEPFADEATADYLARTVLGLHRASRCNRAPLDGAITEYSSACYYEVVYIQGGIVLDDLRERVGTTRFWAAIRGYIEASRFGLGGTRQLLDAITAASAADLLPLLRARFPSLY